jgi:hypothetical protein
MSASLSDILTAAKNIVTAINALAQNYLNVQGILNASGLTADTVVKPASGRLCVVSVIVAGSATGAVYDSATTGATTKPLYVIPTTVGVDVVNIPASFGLFVSPGTGQTVTVSYS